MKRDRQSVNDRHTRILSLLRERREIKVEELSQIFDVSPMTIRRDLQHLEDQGLISRFYGGAVAEQPVSPAGDADQVKLYRDLISQYAANLVAENDQIFINGSRTALGLLDFLGSKNVQVFTNNGLVCARSIPPTCALPCPAEKCGARTPFSPGTAPCATCSWSTPGRRSSAARASPPTESCCAASPRSWASMRPCSATPTATSSWPTTPRWASLAPMPACTWRKWGP